MSNRPKNICWLDLETSGINPATSEVLEVGVVITNYALEVVAEKNWVMGVNVASIVHKASGDVKAMHEANGLWDECEESTLTPQYVDQMLSVFLLEHNGYGDSKTQLAFAGSGVAHFDSEFMKVHLPRSRSHLTFWTIDVGILRRALRLMGSEFDPPAADASTKSHRALDDARQHLAEMIAYREWFGKELGPKTEKDEEISWGLL